MHRGAALTGKKVDPRALYRASGIGAIPIAIVRASVRHGQADGLLDEHQRAPRQDTDRCGPHCYNSTPQRIEVADTPDAAVIERGFHHHACGGLGYLGQRAAYEVAYWIVGGTSVLR